MEIEKKTMIVLEYDTSKSKGSFKADFTLLLPSGLTIERMKHICSETSSTVFFHSRGVKDNDSKTGYRYVPIIKISDEKR